MNIFIFLQLCILLFGKNKIYLCLFEMNSEKCSQENNQSLVKDYPV